MSSHREAPQISKDPNADSTDVYAFVSPDDPSTVTLIANYIPLQAPDGGPNFYEFSDNVRYAIRVDNDGDGVADVSFLFEFKTVNNIPSSFLYNDGPITSLTGSGAAAWNRQQTYTLTRIDYDGKKNTSTVLGTGLPVPPCNVGPLSTPNYDMLASEAIVDLAAGGYTATTFAGQRAEGFYVDLGAVFDLGDLRPFEPDHNQFGLTGTGLMKSMPGVNSTAAVNVHSLALQIPIDQLTSNKSTPTSVTDPKAVIGVWTTASRQRAQITEPGEYTPVGSGPYAQVSRLGNPLVNELLIGIGTKDKWNTQSPAHDKQFVSFYSPTLLGDLLNTLYPGVFPNLAAYNTSGKTRSDLIAILLTGIPASVLPSAPTYTGATQADLLRLNVAVKPATSPSNLGVLGGDVAGFPNGRRVFDDVATIELRAVAGLTIPLVDPSYKPDGAAGEVDFGLTSSGTDLTAMGTESYLSSFPYLGTPWSGMWTPASTPVGNLTNPS